MTFDLRNYKSVSMPHFSKFLDEITIGEPVQYMSEDIKFNDPNDFANIGCIGDKLHLWYWFTQVDLLCSMQNRKKFCSRHCLFTRNNSDCRNMKHRELRGNQE